MKALPASAASGNTARAWQQDYLMNKEPELKGDINCGRSSGIERMRKTVRGQ